MVAKINNKRKTNVLVFEVEKAIGALLLESNFRSLKDVEVTVAPTFINAEKAGYVGGSKQVNEIPKEWKTAAFRKEITRLINDALEKASKADIIVFGGGRDYPGDFYGSKRHKKTNGHDILDARDIVEAYVANYAAAHGKTIYGVCRGHQVFTTSLLHTFADNIPYCQHLPDFLAKHSGKKHSTHHSDSELAAKRNEILSDERWLVKETRAQLLDQISRFRPYGGGKSFISVKKDGFLKDCFTVAKKTKAGRKDIVIKDDAVIFVMADSHHEGFAFSDLDSLKDFKKELKKAGGKIHAFAANPEDRFVELVDGIAFSKEIDEEALGKFRKRNKFLNDMLGLDIKMSEPDLSSGKRPRMDAFTIQAHPESNIGGVALIGPSILLAYTKDKVMMFEQKGVNLKYKEWSHTKTPQVLKHIFSTGINKASVREL